MRFLNEKVKTMKGETSNYGVGGGGGHVAVAFSKCFTPSHPQL